MDLCSKWTMIICIIYILKQTSFLPRLSSHIHTLQFRIHRHILCMTKSCICFCYTSQVHITLKITVYINNIVHSPLSVRFFKIHGIKKCLLSYTFWSRSGCQGWLWHIIKPTQSEMTENIAKFNICKSPCFVTKSYRCSYLCSLRHVHDDLPYPTMTEVWWRTAGTSKPSLFSLHHQIVLLCHRRTSLLYLTTITSLLRSFIQNILHTSNNFLNPDCQIAM